MNNMKKYLISACLGGENVRYDGQNCLQQQLKQLIETNQAMMICPEVSGGLATPRLPAEIVGGDGYDVLNHQAKVIDLKGNDVTVAFISGAEETLKLAQKHQITHVILKANSPSCGSNMIYDGSFTGQKIRGVGVSTALLQQHGFEVMTEDEFLVRLNYSSLD